MSNTKNDAKNVPESATEQSTGNTPAAPGIKFREGRNLTLPLLKMEKDAPVYVRIDSEIVIGKKVQADKDPAIICEVTDLMTGEKLHFLVPAVLQGILHDEFGAPKFGKLEAKGDVVTITPANNPRYVGQAFALTDQGKKEGKNYKGMSVTLLELTE